MEDFLVPQRKPKKDCEHHFCIFKYFKLFQLLSEITKAVLNLRGKKPLIT